MILESTDLSTIKTLLEYNLIQSAHNKLEFLLNAHSNISTLELEYLYVKTLWKSNHVAKTKYNLGLLLAKISEKNCLVNQTLVAEIYRIGIEIYYYTKEYTNCLNLYMYLYNTTDLQQTGLQLELRDILLIRKIYKNLDNKNAELVFLKKILVELPFADEISLRIAEIEDDISLYMSELLEYKPAVLETQFKSATLDTSSNSFFKSEVYLDYFKALLDTRKNRFTDAIKRLKALVVKRDIMPAIVYAKLGTCYFMIANNEQALLYYKMALKLDPNIVDEIGNYAHILYALKNDCELVRLGERLVKSEPNRIEGHLALAKSKMLRGDYKEAFAQIEKGMEKLADFNLANNQIGTEISDHLRDSEVLTTISEIYYEMGELKNAKIKSIEAYKLNPNYRIMNQLIECLLASGDLTSAVNVIKKNKKNRLYSEPEKEYIGNLRLMVLTAKILMNIPDNIEESVELLKRVISMLITETGSKSTILQSKNSNSERGLKEEAVILLVTVFMSNEQHQDAMEVLKKQADDLNSDIVYALYGDVLTITEDLTKATVYYNLALSINMHNKRAKDGILRIEELTEDCSESTTHSDSGYLDENIEESGISEYDDSATNATGSAIQVNYSSIDGIDYRSQSAADLIIEPEASVSKQSGGGVEDSIYYSHYSKNNNQEKGDKPRLLEANSTLELNCRSLDNTESILNPKSQEIDWNFSFESRKSNEIAEMVERRRRYWTNGLAEEVDSQHAGINLDEMLFEPALPVIESSGQVRNQDLDLGFVTKDVSPEAAKKELKSKEGRNSNVFFDSNSPFSMLGTTSRDMSEKQPNNLSLFAQRLQSTLDQESNLEPVSYNSNKDTNCSKEEYKDMDFGADMEIDSDT
ncbi:hypothetical protein BB561_005309 [Smittium simulii]|uniref:Anaphase-promoting complex subunit 5 domain-containing protein n=1 Tax=Smittium simulii TaxID=133385 RepID=A0A2T9YAY3_9FUNG|nr:hypothetical protein BB561_005309 [Smittium simulii]